MSIELNSRNSRERLNKTINSFDKTGGGRRGDGDDHGAGATSPDYSDPEDTLKSRLKIKDSYFREGEQ